MLTDEIDFASLSNNKEEAFIQFEKQVRENYERSSRNDRDFHSDMNGNYNGSYAPEKSYVKTLLAFLDACELNMDIPDISKLSGNEFEEKFGEFRGEIIYLITRFAVQKNRITSGDAGTVILIEQDYKIEIGQLLNTVRKIVNQEINEQNKKEKIFKKIASLQSEIDRDRTTIDALFGRTIDLSKIVGEFGGNIEPLIDKMERIKKLIWDNSKKENLIPQSSRPKLIPKKSNEFAEEELEDEIPF
jgi:hypothetical protein